MQDDRELMVRAQEGEQSALEMLFARWEAPLFAFFYRIGCPPSAIEDLTEEVLVALYRQCHRYDRGRPFAPWVYGIARLIWKDHLRRRRRAMAHHVSLEAVGDLPSTSPAPSRVAEAREEAEAIHRAIERLPEDQRITFVLRHYQELSYEEIAETLGAPLGTIKWRIHEAVRRVEATLAAWRAEGV